MNFIYFEIYTDLAVRTNIFNASDSQKIKRQVLGMTGEFDEISIEMAIGLMKKLETNKQLYIIVEDFTINMENVYITNKAGDDVGISIYDYLLYNGVELNYAYIKNRLAFRSDIILLDRVYVELMKSYYKLTSHLWDSIRRVKSSAKYVPSHKVGIGRGINCLSSADMITFDTSKYTYMEIRSHSLLLNLGYNYATEYKDVKFTSELKRKNYLRFTGDMNRRWYKAFMDNCRIVNNYANMLILNIKTAYPEFILYDVIDMVDFKFIIPISSITDKMKKDILDLIKKSQGQFELANYVVIGNKTSNEYHSFHDDDYTIEKIQLSTDRLVIIDEINKEC